MTIVTLKRMLIFRGIEGRLLIDSGQAEKIFLAQKNIALNDSKNVDRVDL